MKKLSEIKPVACASLRWLGPDDTRAGYDRIQKNDAIDLRICINKRDKQGRLSLVFRFYKGSHLKIDPNITHIVCALDRTTERIYFKSAEDGFRLIDGSKKNREAYEAKNVHFSVDARNFGNPGFYVQGYKLAYDPVRGFYYINVAGLQP